LVVSCIGDEDGEVNCRLRCALRRRL